MLTPLVSISVDQMGLQWVPIPYPSGGWQPSSQVSISFLLHETALFTQEGGLLDTCFLGKDPGEHTRHPGTSVP